MCRVMSFSTHRFALASALFLFGCGGSVTPTTDNSQTPGDETSTTDDSTSSGSDTAATDDSTTPVTDDGLPPGDSIAPPGDTSTPPTDGGSGKIACGMTTTCDAATQECCITMAGAKCITKGTMCGGATLACTDSTSCPTGDVCCGTFGGGSAGANCVAAGMCMGRILCSTSAECPAGETCQNSFGGVKTCRKTFGDAGAFDAAGFDGGFPKFDAGAGG